jgi:hypothetical protein
MTKETCIALSAVFPLILVTMAIEHRRALRFVDRREGVFKWIVEYGTMGSVIGLVMSVVGVQTNGLNLSFTIIVWALFAGGVFGLALTLVAIVEQDREDRDEDRRKEAAEHERQRLRALEVDRLNRVWWRRLLGVRVD